MSEHGDGFRVTPGFMMGQMAGRFDIAAGAWQGLAHRFTDLTMNEYDLGILGQKGGIIAAYNDANDLMVSKLSEGQQNLTLAGDALYDVRAAYAHAETESSYGFRQVEE